MRVEDLKGWFREAMREKNPVQRQWQILVRLIQRTFGYGTVLDEATWAKNFFLLKGKGGHQGIGLVGVVWKVYAAVVKVWLNRCVELHDTLYGFSVGMGTGTTTLEENLKQQLVGIVNKPLFKEIVDVRKAYDLLDRGRCREILWGYRVGPKMAHLLSHHWYNQQFLLKVGIF